MKKFGILLSIIFVISAKAQDKKSYSFTLDQAISHALTNNRQAINAGRDIEISKQRKWETTAMGLPSSSFVSQISVVSVLLKKSGSFHPKGLKGTIR